MPSFKWAKMFFCPAEVAISFPSFLSGRFGAGTARGTLKLPTSDQYYSVHALNTVRGCLAS